MIVLIVKHVYSPKNSHWIKVFWIHYISYSTRRQTNSHTKLPDESQFLKCGSYPKKFPYFKQVRKQNLFVHIFSSNWKLALAVSTLAERQSFQLIGKTMPTFLISLMMEVSTRKHPQNKARQCILPLLCLLLQISVSPCLTSASRK